MTENDPLEAFQEKYGDIGKTDKYYGNMHAVCAGQVCQVSNGCLGKKTGWGFDRNKPTPAYSGDVESEAREYAESRPCITRQATPEELAEVERMCKRGVRRC